MLMLVFNDKEYVIRKIQSLTTKWIIILYVMWELMNHVKQTNTNTHQRQRPNTLALISVAIFQILQKKNAINPS